MRRAIVLGLWCLPVACNGSCSPGRDAGPQISLGVTSAQVRKRLGLARPAAQQTYIDVAVALKNVGEAEPLPVGALSFQLGTADQLQYPEAPTDGVIGFACPAQAAIEVGDMLACHVAFQIPETATVTQLRYSDGMARAASAAIPEVAPALPSCAYWQTPLPISCLPCAASSDNGCRPQQVDLANSCAAELQKCGYSNDPCQLVSPGCPPSAACASAVDAVQDCVYMNCFSSCPQAGL